jgi:hypothetical protein
MNEQQAQAILEELRSHADAAKSQIDQVVASIQNLIDDRDSKTTRATEEIIYPSVEMLELR